MSLFSESMEMGNEALLAATGDPAEYWPGGDEEEARDINVIWTGLERGGRADLRAGESKVSRVEAQVWADDDRGIADPELELDVIVFGSVRWVVMEVIETVAGMHRLRMERGARDVVGKGRGRERARRRSSVDS